MPTWGEMKVQTWGGSPTSGSGMTLEGMIAEVSRLKEDLSTSDITAWINQCLGDLSSVYPVEKSVNIIKIANQNAYTLPSDFIRVLYVIDDDEQLTMIPMSDKVNTGYKLWGNSILLQPTPTETGTMELYYHGRIPKLVGATDVPAIPEEFHDLPVLFATAKAQYMDEELGMRSDAYQEYLARKEELRRYAHRRDQGPTEILDVYGVLDE